MRKRIVLIVLTTLILTIGAYFAWISLSPLKIKSTSPTNNEQEIALKPVISVVFTKDIRMGDYVIEISPSVALKTELSSKKAINLIPQENLKTKSVYTVTIISDKLPEKRYEFKFITKDADELGLGDEEVWSQAKKVLRDKLPQETKEYSIDYWPEKDTFLVTIKWPPCKEVRQRIIDWFSKEGFDYTKLKITWTTAKGLPKECYNIKNQ